MFCVTDFYDEISKEYLRRKYHCTVDLLFDWFGISCMTTDNFRFYLQNRLIQTSKTEEVNGRVILPPLVFPEISISIFSIVEICDTKHGVPCPRSTK
jgi:hypothetical protein